MLGISTPDAIALGTLILALLAAWKGRRSGEAARVAVPPDPTVALLGGALVDHRTLRDLVDAVRGLDATIARALDERAQRDSAALGDVLRRATEALDAHRSRTDGDAGA